MTIDPRDFRNALARFATGINVITTTGPDGRPAGVTVNAFSSVSLDPPLVLFCMGKGSSSHDLFTSAEAFAINILAADQEHLSNLFAGKAENKFAGVEVETGKGGCPLLTGCLATLECRREALHDGGDHTIVVGRVENLRYAEDGAPLLYFNSAYTRIGDGA